MDADDPLSRHVAIDLGAESGRVMVGEFDGARVALHEAYRFPNQPVRFDDEMHWDFWEIRNQVETGLGKTLTHGQPDSIGIDSWGCDFALFQEDGEMLGSPFHYRDPRTIGIPDDVFATVSEQDVYAATGSQMNRFNTIFQLMVDKNSGTLDYASHFLMMPDALAFWLCGDDFSEVTIASPGDDRPGSPQIPAARFDA